MGHTVAVLGMDVSYGTVSGIADASTTETPVLVLSPNFAMTATRATFIVTRTVGEQGMNIYLRVNGVVTALACTIRLSNGCTSTEAVSVPANSRLSIDIANCCAGSPGDLLATVELREGT